MNIFARILKSPQITGSVSSSSDLSHVTQEMYKKNFELAETNRTLSILRKIDELILSTVTNVNEIAQHVADLVATEAEFKAVLIFIYNKNTNRLERIALSNTEIINTIKLQFPKQIYRENIVIAKDHNIIEQTFNEKKIKVTHELKDLLNSELTQVEIDHITEALQIKSSIIYPLIVRDDLIGTLIISLGEDEEKLFDYQKELIQRFAAVIGIAIDNALLYRKIQDANEKLQELDRLKDEFVSLASHELRTPMTVIKSYLWMVLNGKGGVLTDKQTFYLDRAYKSTDRLIEFVNEMLNVSRIESNRVTIRLTPLHLDTLVKEIVSEIEPRALELKIHLAVFPFNNLPMVTADPDKIREVIINLLGNSMKFTQPGGSISISFSIQDGFVRTDVKDTGIGMVEEDIPKLFHKFGMVGNNYLTKTNSQGTGLGLYISKSIIELHGGEVRASSEGIAKGSTFSFTLKIAGNETTDTEKIEKEDMREDGLHLIP